MSHFSVLVITESRPSKEELAAILQPWHEYECTGVEDQYVIDVDITDKVMKKFNDPVDVVILTDGSMFSQWDNRFRKTGKFVLPEGAREAEVTADVARSHNIGYETADELAEEYFGGKKNGRRFYCRTNPNKKWDWWQVGGRWTGMLNPVYDPESDPNNSEICFLCKGTGKRPDMKIENGCNGCEGTGIRTKWPTQWAKFSGDQIQRKDLPLEALRTKAEIEAAEKYDLFHRLLAGRKFPDWDALLAEHGADKARDIYWSDEAVKDISQNEMFRWPGSTDGLTVSRIDYLKAARDGAISSFAVVKDGKWYQRGEMGWFGAVSKEKEGEVWQAEFAKLIESMSPDHWLTVVDCHI